MNRLYPKNFVLLLLLLIFLEAIYDSTGLIKGVGAMYMDDESTSCTHDSHCAMGFQCGEEKKCVCRNTFKNSKLGNRQLVFFHKKTGTCVAPIGKICTREVDELYPIPCVPYSFCASQGRNKLPQQLGLCQCNPGYEETRDHLCQRAMVIQIPDENSMMTMAQRRVGYAGGSTEENIEGDPDTSQDSSTRGTQLSNTDSEDANRYLVDQRSEKKWEPTILSKGASQCVQDSRFLLIVIVILTRLLQF